MSATEAEEYLADKEYDEFVIRPSSDPDQIAVTFKFSPWSYVHIKAVEDGDSKDPSSNKTYKIGSSVFDDINQLVLEYVDPLMTFVAEMRSFRYFQDLRSPEIERICQEKKVAQPKHNPYFIGPSDQAGSFLLHYIPGTRTVVKESVTVTPSGYRFRGKMFQSTGDLFNWFKKHFAEGPPKKQRPAATPNPRTPAAPVTNGQYAPGSWGGAGWPQQQQNNWVGYSAGGVEDLWAATPAAAPNQWAAQPAASASDPWSANTTSTW
jgi:transcription elongation factor SPT6